MKFLVIFLLTSLVFSDLLQAAHVYLYHPNSTLALGRGFEPNIIAEPKLNCLEFTPHEDIQNGGATSTTFFMTVVNSSQELKQVLGIDFSMDARELNTSVNVGFNLNNESLFNKNSVSVVITASSEFGTQSMEKPKLTDHAQKMIDNVHFDAFREECGTHLVTQAVLGVRVAVVITIDNLKTALVREIKNNAGFNSNSGTMSFDMQMKLNDLLKRTGEYGSIRVNIYATGSRGVEDLEGIVKNLDTSTNALSKVQAELGTYLTKFPVSKAVPVRFYAKEFGFGFQNKFENLWKAHYERKIQRIAQIYKELAYDVDIAKSIYDDIDVRSLILSKEEKKALLMSSKGVENYLDGLVELHRNCQYNIYKELDINNPNRSDSANPDYCKFDETEAPSLNIPEMPEVPVLVAEMTVSGGKTTDLEIQASAIDTVEVYYNERMIQKFVYNKPNTVDYQRYGVNLDRYWSFRKSHVNGPLVGKIVVKDLYGRTTVWSFHYALHAEGGSLKPYTEIFSRTGLESN